ncbi:hypothetical protein DIURU_002013 [Diutina rugosa]|uniref:CFEM domain-containing protein n=1 Tax=Diutina rugosa TaxID=5481 RepID=A0A642URR1_DIURU|nr:uncharacterized protein DIURU_002013 [Diutina rugosa]KAA8904061.1 hypothetical protein DIURU_002013 [Diutina rugosa]
MKLTTIAFAAIAAAVTTPTNFETFPEVPKTASINGFADPVYTAVAECAQECLVENKDTGNTPCPYWDTGCLCVMSQFANPIADCWATACKGQEVSRATMAAYSACQAAGVWAPYWFIGTDQQSDLAAAATAT